MALKWFNQKIGNFFRDFKEDRELREDPDVCRGITRLVCLLTLLSAFGFVFYDRYEHAPDIEVKRVYLDNKTSNVAINCLYNSSASYGTDIDAANITSTGHCEDKSVLDCPCANTTISWTSFVHFYIINYTTTNGPPIMDYRGAHNGTNFSLEGSHNGYNPRTSNITYKLFKDSFDLTIEKLYENIWLWPTRLDQNIEYADCGPMVGGLLTTQSPNISVSKALGTTSWHDPRASYFESPSLLSQKDLYSNTLRRLRAYLEGQFTLLNSLPSFRRDNATHRRMFLTGVTELLLYPLEKFGANSSCTDYDFFMYAANTSASEFEFRTDFWPEQFAVVLYEGQSFLGMNINWTEYYNQCWPSYCDVIKMSTTFNRAFTQLAVIGGLWGISVVVVTLVLWPAIAFLLVRCSACCRSDRPLKRPASLKIPASQKILSRTTSAYKKLEKLPDVSTNETSEVHL